MVCLRYLLLILMLLFPAIAWSQCPNQNCFIRPGGSDTTCDGSQNEDAGDGTCAFATIQKGIDTAIAGDTVNVSAGVYYEQLANIPDGSIGNEITIQGEDGHKAIIDGGDEVTDTWVSEGNGVYSIATYYEPGAMYLIHNGDAVDIPRCRMAACNTYITRPTDYQVTAPYTGLTVQYWDGIEAMFIWGNPTANKLYVRFRDGSDPNSKSIYTAPEDSNTINLTGTSYVTLKGFRVRSGHTGIYISGSGAHHITLDDLKVYATGEGKFYMIQDGGNITIKNSEFYENGAWHLGIYNPGAWNDGTLGVGNDALIGVREMIYRTYKYDLSDSASSGTEGRGGHIYYAGPNNEIFNCSFYDYNLGVQTRYAPSNEVYIYNSKFFNTGSAAITALEGSQLQVYNNVFEDVSFLVRHQNLQNWNSSMNVYIYNNRMWNPFMAGYALFYHGTEPTNKPNFWIYHNSVAGADAFHRIEVAQGDYENTRFVNNIFSSEDVMYGAQSRWDNANMWDVFGYNWLGGNIRDNNAAWFGWDTNMDREGQFKWDNSARPNFKVAPGDETIGAGVDIRSDFVVDGRTFSGMPWRNLPIYEQNMGWVDQTLTNIQGVDIN